MLEPWWFINELNQTVFLLSIVDTYQPGQEVQVTIEVTANHKGYFEFKLCPNNNVNMDPEQDCFDK